MKLSKKLEILQTSSKSSTQPRKFPVKLVTSDYPKNFQINCKLTDNPWKIHKIWTFFWQSWKLLYLLETFFCKFSRETVNFLDKLEIFQIDWKLSSLTMFLVSHCVFIFSLCFSFSLFFLQFFTVCFSFSLCFQFLCSFRCYCYYCCYN